MNSQFLNYLTWQQERGLVWPMTSKTPPLSIGKELEQSPNVAVLCDTKDDENVMLVKMLKSIGLGEDLITCNSEQPARLRLILEPPPVGKRLGECTETELGFDFYTYHPRDLLEVPELKPIAWQHLKTFAMILKQNGD